MKKAHLYMLSVLLAFGIACQFKSKPLPTHITFLSDFETAKAEALKSKLPIIIEFYADTSWCQYCVQLDSLTFGDSLVIEMANDFVFVRIDAEAANSLASNFGITGYPTVVLTKSDGVEIDRIQGFIDATEFYNQIHLYLQGKETLEDYLARLEDEPDNPEYLLTIAEKYAGRKEFSKAIEFYNKVITLDSDNRRGYASRSLESISAAQAASKDYKSAIATCQDVLKRFPTSLEADDASAMLGYYTALSGDPKGALTIYREYLVKYPEGRNQWVQQRMADLEEKQ
jgi:thioredoxin-like negative regulator of GroEL